MNKSLCASVNILPLDVLGELSRKGVPIAGWVGRISIYIALMVFAGCAFGRRGSDEYLGKWHFHATEEEVSFNFEFSQDKKIFIIMTNKTEVIKLVGNITGTSYLNHEYLLDYKLISATTNGVEIENIPRYYCCVCKIENGKMIAKVDGARTPDDKIRPKLDGAIPPLILVRDEE
ncbi:MAG: hypothetical protein WC381_11015 [Kiritimatiellia bacterium]|jgi:hypothetical protein